MSLLLPVLEAQLGNDLLHLVNLYFRRCWKLWRVQGPDVISVGQVDDVET